MLLEDLWKQGFLAVLVQHEQKNVLPAILFERIDESCYLCFGQDRLDDGGLGRLQ